MHGQVFPWPEIAEMVARVDDNLEEDNGGPDRRPIVLMTSDYRFATRTLHLIRELAPRWRFLVGHTPHLRPALIWSLYPFVDADVGLRMAEDLHVPCVIASRGNVKQMGPERQRRALNNYMRASAIVPICEQLCTDLCSQEPRLRKARWKTIANGCPVPPDPIDPIDLPWPRPWTVWLSNFNFAAKRQALDEIAETVPDDWPGTILIAGNKGPWAPRVGRIKPHVKFLGFVENKWGLIHAADVCLYHSHLDGQPTALMEMLALGKPVVLGRHPDSGASEFVIDGETGVVRSTPEELLHSVRRLLDDADLRARLGAGARRSAETVWTWQRAAARYDALFTELTERR